MTIDLHAKINDLFEYRRLPELIRLGNGGVMDQKFYDKLFDLQASIYFLDHTLETVWETEMDAVENHWKNIHHDLRVLGVADEKLNLYSRHILKYQKHELELRKQKLPMRLSMEYFYFYKSCDVKLLRKLIYDKYPSLAKIYRLSDWRVFDLITEVNDDVEDVYEDLTTINGNRFLLTILRDGVSAAGIEFSEFLHSLEGKLEGYGDVIDDMTVTAYKGTKQLLEERLSSLELEHVQSAVITNYITKFKKQYRQV